MNEQIQKTTNKRIIIQTIKFVRIMFVLFQRILSGFVYEMMSKNNKATSTSTAAAALAVVAYIIVNYTCITIYFYVANLFGKNAMDLLRKHLVCIFLV